MAGDATRRRRRHYDTVIVGGGVAGISCYWELTRGAFRPGRVLLVEARAELCGNVREGVIGGTRVDLGSIEVHPWYAYFRDMLRRGGGAGARRGVHRVAVRRVVWHGDRGEYVDMGEVTAPPAAAAARYLAHAGTDALPPPWRYYDPDLDAGGCARDDGCVAIDFASADGGGGADGDALRAMFESYTFGACGDYSACLLYPLFFRAGGDGTEFIRAGGLRELLAPMVDHRDVLLGATVSRVDVDASTGRKVVHVRRRRGDTVVTADNVVLCCPFGALHRAAIARALGGPPRPPAGGGGPRYTRFYSAVVRLDGPVGGSRPGLTPPWDGALEAPDPDAPYEVASYLGAGAVLGAPDVLVVYVRDRTRGARLPDAAVEVLVRELLPRTAMLAGVRILDVAQVCFFPHAMPTMDVGDVAALRAAQGAEGVWFAGQYLGHPSLETACYTGRKVGAALRGAPLEPAVGDVEAANLWSLLFGGDGGE